MIQISEQDVRRILSVRECIEVLRDALARPLINIPRYRLKSTHALLHVMSASIPELGIMGLKCYSVTKTGAQFAVLLFDESSGALLAVLEADALGQIRTGAASGLATDLLARKDASVGAVFGTGFQAETQLLAIDAVRDMAEVRIYSRSPEKRVRFVQKMQPQVRARLTEVSSAEECARGADVISMITDAREPVLFGEWLKPGCHINAAGVNWANKREVDASAVRRAGLICVDHREQSKIESGDLIGVIQSWDSVVELGDVLNGKAGRSSEDEITFFKSNGIAAEDIAAAHFVLRKM